MTTRETPRRGFSLLEMAGVMGALTLVLLMLVTVLMAALRNEQVAARSTQRLLARAALADQFRADVARATAAPRTLGDLEAGPTCLILRLGDGEHLVYRFRERWLERSTAGEEGPFQRVPLGERDVTVEFGQEAGGRLLSLRLIDVPRSGGPQREFEVRAALGGDLR